MKCILFKCTLAHHTFLFCTPKMSVKCAIIFYLNSDEDGEVCLLGDQKQLNPLVFNYKSIIAMQSSANFSENK